MILRVIRGRASPEQFEALRATLREALHSAVPDSPGPLAHHVGARPVDGMLEVLLVSPWDTAEALTRADKQEHSALRIAAALGVEILEAPHFEVDTPVRLTPSSEVVAIRIARGEFSKPGADIEMLNMLRERVPLLGDEMSEAYVGRRLVGRVVEVTFVSIWRRLPEDWPLEALFWPDIALRYDRLAVDVYETAGAPQRMV